MNKCIGAATMAKLTLPNLPDDIHNALRVRASQHGCSIEAEVRDIQTAVPPEDRVKLGSLLAEIGHQDQLKTEQTALFDKIRETAPPSSNPS